MKIEVRAYCSLLFLEYQRTSLLWRRMVSTVGSLENEQEVLDSPAKRNPSERLVETLKFDVGL